MPIKTVIKAHRLSGGGAKFKASPNHGEVFKAGTADIIVIHFTAGSSCQSSIEHLCSEKTKASAHLVIGRDGEITQLVPFNLIAWHAGNSQWQGRAGLNQYSIGIELDNAGQLTKNEAGQYFSWFNHIYPPEQVFKGKHKHQAESGFWHAYTEAQLEATFNVCQVLCDNYGIHEIVGHDDIAPQRKVDPGPAFPMDKLRQCVVADRSDNGAENIFELQVERTVSTAKLNVRSGPSTDFEAVSRPLAQGRKVRVLERHGQWSKVEFTQTGWVNSQFLK